MPLALLPTCETFAHSSAACDSDEHFRTLFGTRRGADLPVYIPGRDSTKLHCEGTLQQMSKLEINGVMALESLEGKMIFRGRTFWGRRHPSGFTSWAIRHDYLVRRHQRWQSPVRRRNEFSRTLEVLIDKGWITHKRRGRRDVYQLTDVGFSLASCILAKAFGLEGV